MQHQEEYIEQEEEQNSVNQNIQAIIAENFDLDLNLSPRQITQAQADHPIVQPPPHLTTKKRGAYVSTDHSAVSVDSNLIMDLDAYNYISAFLFEGMGTDENPNMDIPERQKIFRQDFVQNPQIFQCLKRPELLPLPTLKRVSIAVVLLAIEELAEYRRSHEEDQTPQDNYTHNKEMANCYARINQFLFGDSLSLQEKSEQIVNEMIVEFKSLHFLSDLAGGIYQDGEYKTYATDQAKINLEEILGIDIFEKLGLSEQNYEVLTHLLSLRKQEILHSIDLGEISLDSQVSFTTEQTLLKCLMSIAISANTEMLPVLHPGYHLHYSQTIQERCKDIVKKFRTERLKASKPKTTKKQKKAVSEPKEARKRKIWTQEETQALADGINAFGNDWVAILKMYSHILQDRNPVALKDRARSMRMIYERSDKPLGVWANASAR